MEVRPVAWTPEHVQRFWDYWASRPDHHATYFAYQVGAGVCRFLQQVRPLAGQRILDYGAGPGYLIEHLLAYGAEVSAVEFSPRVVHDLNERFRGEPGWRTARAFDARRLPWDDETFDMVVCLETIEHLLPEHLEGVLDELLRVVRPEGVVLLTTPNSEDLTAQMVFCPNCCSEFHRWQHVRRWTPNSLGDELAARGFDVAFCQGLSFHDFQPPRGRLRDATRGRFWRRWLTDAGLTFRDLINPRPFPRQRWLQRHLRRTARPHLAAIAVKPAERHASALPPDDASLSARVA